MPVILCGGAGTGLWPLSRELYPKQLLSLTDDRSLLQNTLERCTSFPQATAPILICNEAHRFLVAEQLREIEVTPTAIILEPEGRNTAPAVALGALHAIAQDSDALLLVLPADHLLQDLDTFHMALEDAMLLAAQGLLVTFGVSPTHAETGYGYIEVGAATTTTTRHRARHRAKHRARHRGSTHIPRLVAQFVEKPDAATAEAYLATGKYLWNSGIFVFKAAVYREELDKHRPCMATLVTQAYQSASMDLDFIRVDQDTFKKCPSESMDYAVMESTDSAVVLPLESRWSDLGSWNALWRAAHKNEQNNSLVGDVLVSEVTDSYVRAEARLVAIIGMQHVVVVETADAVLVAPREKAQEVRQIVKQLKARQREEHIKHRRVYRPWGFYEVLDLGKNFQVKRINVTPGASLSLQIHQQRAEHWVVVRGVALVTTGEDTFELHENESSFVPVGVKHRLQNLTPDVLEIIEIQSGDYLGEDDIIRFDDEYGR